MQITRHRIEAYLNCKYKAHLLSKGNRGDPHDLETIVAELQTAFREQAATVLIRKCHKAQASTSDIHSGQEVILAPTLEDGQTAFTFDALRRTDGESSLGPFHYSPVLFWQGETPGRNQTLLMAAGGIILARHQRVQPKTATVIFGSECRARTIQLGNHYKAAQQVIDGLLAMVNEAPRLILNDHCGVCEFREQCREQAIKTDDLSLLGHMTEKKIAHYAQTGTLTVTQLSYTYHARRHKIAHPKQNPRSLPLHALAIRQKRILVIGKPAFPKTDVRIYFDAEGDFDRKFTYLLGLLIVKDGHEEMISLWADDPSQQKRLFEQFVDILKQQQRLHALPLRPIRGGNPSQDASDGPPEEGRRCRDSSLSQCPRSPPFGCLFSDLLQWPEGDWEVPWLLMDGRERLWPAKPRMAEAVGVDGRG